MLMAACGVSLKELVLEAMSEILLVSDRVASDGSLGAPADHEGFPGGPHDPSVLIGFADHVAHNIWSG